MLKFFRKYNKIILVVGGSLLMVAFLVPQALQQLGKAAAGRTIARFDGGSYSQLDVQRAAAEVNAVENILGIERESLGIENEEHWLLLVSEAKRAGFRGGPSDAEVFINQIAGTYAQQLVSQSQGQIGIDDAFVQARNALLQRRTQIAGANTSGIDAALADLFAIQRLRSSYFAAPKMSTARAISFADTVLDTARAQLSIVPADALLAEVPMPSTAELDDQFERFRDVNSGEGELGFGYRQPVGVKVEWITLDPRAIAEAVTLDPIDVRKRFEANRDRYPGDFASERANVRAELTAERVKAILADAEQEIRGRGLDDIGSSPANPTTGLRELPADWSANRTPLEEIAEAVVVRIKDKYGVVIAHPFVGVQNQGWLSPTEFQQLPGLGRAFVRDGLRVTPLAGMLDQIREGMPAGSEATPRFQVGVLDRPAFDSAEQQHYFRFLAARPAGPAPSIDEVRDRVARDLRRLQAYELLVERADAARDALIARGPKAAANTIDPSAGESVVNVSDERAAPIGSPFAGELLTRVLGSAEFRAPVMAAARRLDPLQPIDVQSLEARSLITPVREALAVAFVRITARDPLTREEYEQLQSQIVATAMQEELIDNQGPEANPFSFENMKARLGHKDVGPVRKTDDDTEEGDQTETEPDADAV
jgi:hypothetical protein